MKIQLFKPFNSLALSMLVVAVCISCEFQGNEQCSEIANALECISIQENRSVISGIVEDWLKKSESRSRETWAEVESIAQHERMHALILDEVDRASECVAGLSEVARSELSVRGFDQYLFDLGMLKAVLGSMYFDGKYIGSRETISFLLAQAEELAKMKSLGKTMCLGSWIEGAQARWSRIQTTPRNAAPKHAKNSTKIAKQS